MFSRKKTIKCGKGVSFIDVSIINKKNQLEIEEREKKIVAATEFNVTKQTPVFKEYIKAAYEKYDADGSGELDYGELRCFLDDLRVLQHLPKCDDAIFNKIAKIIDADGDENIELEEFYQNMPEILPILSSPGESLVKSIRKSFEDFDLDGSGYQEKEEVKLQLNLTCDKMNVTRCNDWQIDYIISLIDDDSNAKIDKDEFVENYYIVNRELSKNKKQNTKDRKRRNTLFQEKMTVSMATSSLPINTELFSQGQESVDDKFLAVFTGICRDFQKSAKKKTNKDLILSKEDSEYAFKLDIMNDFGKESAKSLIPLESLINSTANVIKKKSNRNLKKGIEPIPEERHDKKSRKTSFLQTDNNSSAEEELESISDENEPSASGLEKIMDPALFDSDNGSSKRQMKTDEGSKRQAKTTLSLVLDQRKTEDLRKNITKMSKMLYTKNLSTSNFLKNNNKLKCNVKGYSDLSLWQQQNTKGNKPSAFYNKDNINQDYIIKPEDFTLDSSPDQIFEKAEIEKYLIDEWKQVIETINMIDKYMCKIQPNSENSPGNGESFKQKYFQEISLDSFSQKLSDIRKVRAWLELKNSAIDTYLRDLKNFLEKKLPSKNIDGLNIQHDAQNRKIGCINYDQKYENSIDDTLPQDKLNTWLDIMQQIKNMTTQKKILINTSSPKFDMIDGKSPHAQNLKQFLSSPNFEKPQKNVYKPVNYADMKQIMFNRLDNGNLELNKTHNQPNYFLKNNMSSSSLDFFARDVSTPNDNFLSESPDQERTKNFKINQESKFSNKHRRVTLENSPVQERYKPMTSLHKNYSSDGNLIKKFSKISQISGYNEKRSNLQSNIVNYQGMAYSNDKFIKDAQTNIVKMGKFNYMQRKSNLHLNKSLGLKKDFIKQY